MYMLRVLRCSVIFEGVVMEMYNENIITIGRKQRNKKIKKYVIKKYKK